MGLNKKIRVEEETGRRAELDIRNKANDFQQFSKSQAWQAGGDEKS